MATCCQSVLKDSDAASTAKMKSSVGGAVFGGILCDVDIIAQRKRDWCVRRYKTRCGNPKKIRVVVKYLGWEGDKIFTLRFLHGFGLGKFSDRVEARQVGP